MLVALTGDPWAAPVPGTGTPLLWHPRCTEGAPDSAGHPGEGGGPPALPCAPPHCGTHGSAVHPARGSLWSGTASWALLIPPAALAPKERPPPEQPPPDNSRDEGQLLLLCWEQDTTLTGSCSGSRTWPWGSPMEGVGFGAAGTCKPTSMQPPGDEPGPCQCVSQVPRLGARGGPRFTLAPGRPWDGNGHGMWPEPPCLAAPSPTPAPWLWPGNGSREQRRLVAGAGSLPFLQERPRARQGAQERGSGGPARPRRIRPPASTCRQPTGAGKRVASVAEQPGPLPVPRCRHHQPRHSAAGPEVPQDTPAPRHGDVGFWSLRAAPERGRTGQSQSWGGWRAPRERPSLLQPPAPTPAMSPCAASAVSLFLSLAMFPSPSSAPAPSGCGGSRGSGLAVAGAPRASPGQRTLAGSGIAVNALGLALEGQGVPAQLGVGAPTSPPGWPCAWGRQARAGEHRRRGAWAGLFISGEATRGAAGYRRVPLPCGAPAPHGAGTLSSGRAHRQLRLCSHQG